MRHMWTMICMLLIDEIIVFKLAPFRNDKKMLITIVVATVPAAAAPDVSRTSAVCLSS